MSINDLYNLPRAIHVIISASELDHVTYVAPLVWLQSPYQLQACAAGRMPLHQWRHVGKWCHHPREHQDPLNCSRALWYHQLCVSWLWTFPLAWEENWNTLGEKGVDRNIRVDNILMMLMLTPFYDCDNNLKLFACTVLDRQICFWFYEGHYRPLHSDHNVQVFVLVSRLSYLSKSLIFIVLLFVRPRTTYHTSPQPVYDMMIWWWYHDFEMSFIRWLLSYTYQLSALKHVRHHWLFIIWKNKT